MVNVFRNNLYFILKFNNYRMKDCGKIYLLKASGGYYEKIKIKKNNRDFVYIAWNLQHNILL